MPQFVDCHLPAVDGATSDDLGQIVGQHIGADDADSERTVLVCERVRRPFDVAAELRQIRCLDLPFACVLRRACLGPGIVNAGQHGKQQANPQQPPPCE